MIEKRPLYIYDQDKWMVAEDIKNIFFYFCHIWLRSFANNLENSCGKNYKKVLAVFHGTDMQFYYGERDSAKFEEYLVNKIENDQEFGKQINREIYKHSDLLRAFADKLAKKDLSQLSRNEIASLINEEFIVHTNFYEWAWLQNATDMFHGTFTKRLKKHLQKYTKDEETTNNYLNILTTPLKHSVVAGQELEFLKIIEDIQKDKPNLKTISLKTLGKNELNSINEYQNRYQYVKYLWLGKEGIYSVNDYISRINEFLSTGTSASKEIKRINDELDSKIKAKKNLEKRLKINADLKKLLAVYSEFLLTKAYRRDAQLKWSYEINRLLEEIAKRLGLTIGEAIQKILVEGSKVIPKDLETRKIGYVSLLKNSIFTINFGQEALKLAEQIEMEVEKINHNINKFSGQIGSQGIAKGIVRKILRAQDSHFLKQGEILVCSMTSPDYVPAMKIAAAIVTDEGGLLCHAAIISRELGKPCIVGTKIATKVLKDGDIVEVDAKKGQIKIIEGA